MLRWVLMENPADYQYDIDTVEVVRVVSYGVVVLLLEELVT